jgi:carbon-monoxide dehydrogenase medium subunit
MTTALEADELLADARIALLAPDARFGFSEFSRRAGDFAIAMALATYRLRDGVMTEPRVGIGGIEEAPRRIAQAEAALEGKRPGEAAFLAAADAVARAAAPLDDVRYPARYRREVARAMAHRALERTAA